MLISLTVGTDHLEVQGCRKVLTCIIPKHKPQIVKCNLHMFSFFLFGFYFQKTYKCPNDTRLQASLWTQEPDLGTLPGDIYIACDSQVKHTCSCKVSVLCHSYLSYEIKSLAVYLTCREKGKTHKGHWRKYKEIRSKREYEKACCGSSVFCRM